MLKQLIELSVVYLASFAAINLLFFNNFCDGFVQMGMEYEVAAKFTFSGFSLLSLVLTNLWDIKWFSRN